ncbi:hypothetical protein J6590_007458 [Homalodisca vitripennis]|nr:hypothetical protein J6590_007458 [Homalodisca vitripennis]
MEMEQDPFDTERFIDEIEKRRALWDLESPDYKNRVLKRSAEWEEVVDIFSKTESTVEEKKQLGIVLQKRWKNLRDSFARELRKKRLRSLAQEQLRLPEEEEADTEDLVTPGPINSGESQKKEVIQRSQEFYQPTHHSAPHIVAPPQHITHLYLAITTTHTGKALQPKPGIKTHLYLTSTIHTGKSLQPKPRVKDQLFHLQKKTWIDGGH